MQKFCEMYITTYKDNSHWAKLANRWTPSIWVSYAEGHPTSTYQIFNPKTKKIILTQDLIFLQKSYGDYIKVDKPVAVSTSYERLDEEEELIPVVINNSDMT